MKNRLYFLLLAVLFGSCDNFVDIIPKGQNIPQSVDDYAKVLNMSWNVGYGGMNWFYMTDDPYLSQAEQTSAGASTTNAYLWQPYMYTLLENDPDWANEYMIIYYANYVIKNIHSASEGVSYSRGETYARALLHRAYSYWYLVSAYAPFCTEAEAEETLAVPMPLDPDINVQYPQSTVAEVYRQIFADIDTALNQEELSDLRVTNTWPCRAAAYALLSRIYLYQSDWQAAADNARLSLDIYDYLNDYNDITMIDPTNASAGLVGYENTAIRDPEVILSKSAPNNFTDVMVSQELVNLYDHNKDLRFRFCFADKTPQNAPLDGWMRVNDEQTFDGIRNSEVYLNYIEALVRLGGTENIAEARQWLEALRAHRYENPDPLPAMSDEDLLQEVLDERHRELRFTGLRWFDMKRLAPEFGWTFSRLDENGNTVTLEPNSPRYTWAIPLDIMEQNGQLIQNPR